MSDVTEDCYYAGWLVGAEYIVPELCRRALESGRTQKWGHGEVTPERARGLTYLADQLGCWVNYDLSSNEYVSHDPFPLPVEHLESLDLELSRHGGSAASGS